MIGRLRARFAAASVTLLVLAAAAGPMADVLGGAASAGQTVLTLVFARFLFGGLIGFCGLLAMRRFRPPALMDLWSHAQRAALLVMSLALFLAGLERASLVEALGGFYLAPLAAAAAGAAFFGAAEPDTRRSFGSGLTLFGGLVMIAPSDGFNLGGANALAAGLVFGGYMLAERMSPLSGDVASVATTRSLIVAAALAPFVGLSPLTSAGPSDLVAFAVVGGLWLVFHMAALSLNRRDEGGAIPPFFATGVAASALASALILGEAPGPAVMLGVTAVFFGGLLMAGRVARATLGRSDPLGGA